MPTDFWAALSSRTGRYLLTRALWMSFIITLVMFAYILYSEFDRGRQQIRHDLSQIENSYASSLSRSIWNFDAEQVEIQLHGILNFPGIQHVQIDSRDLGIIQAGERPQSPDEQYAFPLHYKDPQVDIELGHVNLLVSYAHIYAQLKDIALRILLVQLLKTLTISMLLLSLIHRLITRHLITLSRWANQFGLDHLDQVPDIGRRSNTRDELSALVDAITRMQSDLQTDIKRREQAEQAVRETRNHLTIAIDNASMGFGLYNANTNRLEANSHLCHQLRISKDDLQSHPAALNTLIERIEGPAGTEQRERINQLLQGRVQRIQGEIILRKFNEQIGTFDVTIQTVSYQDNRPYEILICSIDKSREHMAIAQVQELSISMESRITRATESLHNDLLLIRAAYERIKRDYERCKISQTDDRRLQFMQFLADTLVIEQHRQPDEAGRHRLASTRQALELLATPNRTDFDLAAQIHDWYNRHQADFQHCQVNLPYSLVLYSNPLLFQFLLDWLTHTQFMETSRPETRLTLQLSLSGPWLNLRMIQQHPSIPPSASSVESVYLLTLAQYMVNLKARGQLEISTTQGCRELLIKARLEDL